MTIGVLLESSLDEGRVALVPSVLPLLTKAGLSVVIDKCMMLFGDARESLNSLFAAMKS